MNNRRNANRVVIFLICTLAFIIIGLLYTDKKEIKKEIQAATETSKENDDNEFEIWIVEGNMEEAVNTEVEKYRNKYPDIKFKVKVFKKEIYNENLMNAARTNCLPDMFYTWGDRRLKELVDLNVVKDITEEVNSEVRENIRESIMRDTLKSYKVDNKIYGLPVCGWDTVMYCNKEIFEANSVSIPKTYDELLDVSQKLLDNEITPIAIGGDEAGMASLYFMELAISESNVMTIENIVNNSELLKKQPFVNAAKRYRQLIMLHPWQKDYDEASSQQALQTFIDGNAAMMVGGSWMSYDIQNSSSAQMRKNVQVIPFPVNSESGYFKGVAGYNDGFALNVKSELEDENINLLFVKLVKDISDCVVEKKGLGLPLYKDQSLDGTEFDILKQCEIVFPVGSYHSAYDQLFSVEQVKKYNMGIKEFVKGHITEENFLEEIAK